MTPPLTMPAETGSTLIQHYAEVRARLYGRRPVVRRAAPPVPVAAPEHAPVVKQSSLNMLAPCSWRFLVALAALRGDVFVTEIFASARSQQIARARLDAMASVYRHTQYSMTKVGQLFQRDHATVAYALTKTGGTAKLVELSPSAAAARRPQMVSQLSAKDADFLEEENRQLRRLLGAEVGLRFIQSAKDAFGVSAGLGRILHVLYIGKARSMTAIMMAAGEGSTYPSADSIKVQISRLRAALAPHDISIQHDIGIGYSMTDDDRAKATELLEAAGL